MSIVSALIPAEAIAANAFAVARPLIGLGLLAAVLVFFKPMLSGLLRAALLVIKPNVTAEQRIERERTKGLWLINRVATDVEIAHPGLASELRAIAARS